MNTRIRIAIGQINVCVGDIEGNTEAILETARRAQEVAADIVLFPELALIGYPPEDLLLRSDLDARIGRAFAALCRANADQADASEAAYWVVGYPKRVDGQLFNMAGVIHQGRLLLEYAKQYLPNYQVFDEKRYFQPGHEPGFFEVKGTGVGLSLCEDIWFEEPTQQVARLGAQILLSLNASPFDQYKARQRLEVVQSRAQENALAIVYANLVGGQDELVFDGGSFVVTAEGTLCQQGAFFQEQLMVQDVVIGDEGLRLCPAPDNKQRHEAIQQAIQPPATTQLSQIYDALVLGVRDYVTKNHFSGVIIGLSGGIDSALTLAIAVDALGAKRVQAVMMPFTFTAAISLEDAALTAQALKVHYQVLPIDAIVAAFQATLPVHQEITAQNIQARARGVLLMTLSNETGRLVLTTGNKSELAVGYTTLYGDMVGAFNALKDVYKTMVFDLARLRNRRSEVIPKRIITRPPSAELAPDQKDSDSLPAYAILDPILKAYIDEDRDATDIIAQGFEQAVVYRVLGMVDCNEFKRRQAATGVRISQKAFGRDRRLPITNRWHPSVQR